MWSFYIPMMRENWSSSHTILDLRFDFPNHMQSYSSHTKLMEKLFLHHTSITTVISTYRAMDGLGCNCSSLVRIMLLCLSGVKYLHPTITTRGPPWLAFLCVPHFRLSLYILPDFPWLQNYIWLCMTWLLSYLQALLYSAHYSSTLMITCINQ